MKFCKNCSAALEDDAVFCTECGISLADDDFSSAKQNNTKSSSDNSYQANIPAYSSDYNQTNNNTNAGSTSGQQQYNVPQGNNPGVPWLIVSIVMLFCCSSIFAIPGLVFSIMSMTSFNAGDIQDSKQKAKTAMILTIVGIFVGIIFNIAFWTGSFGSGIFDSTFY